MDLSTVEQIHGARENRLVLQSRALERRRHFTHIGAGQAERPFRLLALCAPGDFMANTPLEFLLENSAVAIEMLFILPNEDFPSQIPDHDVAFVAVAESDDNQPILAKIGEVLPKWPKPVINPAQQIARLTRDGAWASLHDAAGVVMPVNRRLERAELLALAQDAAALKSRLDGVGYPIIVRPVGSHAGEGLAKIDNGEDLSAYLEGQSARSLYIAPFVDYRGRDGLFRKVRLALIEGVPFVVHMAISPNWMVHYLNADMLENERNRIEEARFMELFDSEFATRHAAALRAVAERVGVDYLLIDCAETLDGQLLIFEVGTAMIVHSLDSEQTFPYKGAHTRKLFKAFEQMVLRRIEQKRGH